MADPLTCLKQRSGDNWLVGYDSQEFFALAERVLGELRSRPQSKTPLTILLAERDPLTFLAHFIAACAANCHIILANPDWAQAEWQQVFELVQPAIVWGEVAKAEARSQKSEVRSQESEIRSQKSEVRSQKSEARSQKSTGQAHSPFPTPHSPLPTPHSPLPTPHSPLPTPHILIPTGGTSGNIRFAIHTWDTLMASVQGFCDYFEVEQINSFCVLPLYHVSGLMQCLRSFTTGGRLVIMPFKSVERGERSSVHPEEFFLSLVPTQLQRLFDSDELMISQESEVRSQKSEVLPYASLPPLPPPLPHSRSAERSRRSPLPTPHSPLPTPHSPIAWLSRFHTVLLGGAPAWASLLDRARSHRIRLAPTYGMTETASQIATLKPDDFLNGHTNAGQVLPHAQLTIRSSSGDILQVHQVGAITIQSKALAIGYYPPLPTPHSPLPTPFQPDDLGYLDAQGYLHIIGRQTDKIITGGENVFPADVEAAIRATGLIQDVCVVGISDRQWGQAIAAIYSPISADISIAMLQSALVDKLSKFKRPKHWLAVAQLPRNAQGKVNRAQIEAIAKQRLSTVLAIE